MTAWEHVATVLGSDPYDERGGPYFSQYDLQRMKKLPAGSRLFVQTDQANASNRKHREEQA